MLHRKDHPPPSTLQRLTSGGTAALAMTGSSSGGGGRLDALSAMRQNARPAAFDLERWLRIFYALVAGNAEDGVSLARSIVFGSAMMAEIRMLGNMGVVVPVGGSGSRFSCLLPLSDAVELGHNLGIELVRYLHDPATDRGGGGIGGGGAGAGRAVGGGSSGM